MSGAKVAAGVAMVAAVLSGLGVFACAFGAIWTDATGRQDDISVHLWESSFVLVLVTLVLAGAAGLFQEMQR